MNMVQRVIARVGTTTAVILALAGLPNLAQATDHTTGHQVGKVAAFAEICGYGSRARQIHNRYSEMADFADGYAYWRQYLGKYDSVRTQCGQIKDISDQLISLNPRDLGAQEPVEKATPENFDGRWIFEIADTSNLSAPDRRVVEIRDNRFTTEILVNGWRGIIRGEVNKYGRLVGQGTVSTKGWGRQNLLLKFAAEHRSGGFRDDVLLDFKMGTSTFRIKLTRETDDGPSRDSAHGEVDLQDAVQPVEPSPEPTNYHSGLRAFNSGDYAVAAQEWLVSASHGDVTSQFRLAQLYEQGLGVPQDFVQAHRWYNIAGSQGHAEARESRDALGNRMTANQLAEAQRLATETSLLPQFGLNQPDVPSGDQKSAHTPRDISRFDGFWESGARLHRSSPKGRCGDQIVTIRILDGHVSGDIRFAVSFYRDAAAGAYQFSGTIDQTGNVQAKGVSGLSITGAVSDETSMVSGNWDLSSVGCRGTFSGSKKYGGQDL